jgi:phosphatidylserine/phosphatidylglycerophosphate/cardiolipin synthase-like enzyme
MRVSANNDHLRVKAIAGTHVVLMALDMDEETRKGLRGFAIKRGEKGQPQSWLKGIKYFEELVTNPVPKDDYSSREQPFQSFLWSDYRASPGTDYDFTIVPLYGDLHALEERHTLTFSIGTEPEFDQKHGVWFNRGTIASHAFETQFHNKSLTDEMVNNVSDDGKLLDDETRWLSRGLAEACLKYINDTQPGEALRVCAYEFTYLPVLKALKRALDRGVDVQIVYHYTKKDKDANLTAIGKAELPEFVTRAGKKIQVLYVRTRTAIPHNKFIVKLVGGKPTQVWTGSTNFTDTGFFGQTNVGHLVTDTDTATTYLKYWTTLAKDPPHKQALKNALDLTANPANALTASSIAMFFSPRTADNMLDWYGQRIVNSAAFAMMTIPFNVATPILTALGTKRDAMRLVILEDVPTSEVDKAEKLNRGKLAFSNGAILGKDFIKYKTSFGGAQVTPIPNSDLDQWFVNEELARPTNNGHVFFVHSKVLLIDPLSDDPLVCSGSANFSKNSLTANDENMLLIRGETRVADIYMTEMDRIFRHFRSRDIINEQASAGVHNPWRLLDPTDQWIESNFKEGNYKNNRRLLFFPGPGTTKPWSVLAAADPDPFLDEDERATKLRSDRNAKARERKAGGAAKGKPKTASKKKTVSKKKTAPKKKAQTSSKTKKKKKTAAPKKRKTAKRSPKTKKKASKKANKAAARKKQARARKGQRRT